MTTDELVREINNCSSYKALRVPFLNFIKIFTSDDFTLMTFENSTKYLSDIDIQFDSLKRTVNSRCSDLGNFYALLDLINEFVNTPLNKREPEKKYRVRLRGFNSDGGHQYLTVSTRYSTINLGSVFAAAWTTGLKQTFTAEELNKIRERFKGSKWIVSMLNDGVEEVGK